MLPDLGITQILCGKLSCYSTSIRIFFLIMLLALVGLFVTIRLFFKISFLLSIVFLPEVKFSFVIRFIDWSCCWCFIYSYDWIDYHEWPIHHDQHNWYNRFFISVLLVTNGIIIDLLVMTVLLVIISMFVIVIISILL